MILNIIGFIIIFFIMIVLVKRGKFRTTVKLGYFYKHFGNKLSISYKKFTGLEYYNFVFKKGEKITISYDVTVEEGELTVKWSDRKQVIWKETFTEDRQGTFTAEIVHRFHSVKVEGSSTKGGCRIEFTESS